MKKKLALFGTFALASGLLIGCGGNGENGGTEPEENGAGENGGGDRHLVVYSNSLTDERTAWLEEAATEAGFDLDLVTIGGGDLPTRLISEVNNPVADVVFGLNNMNFEVLKANDVLTPFVPDWADEIELDSNDPDGYFHSTVQQAILLAYNTALMDADSAPTDWPDLWENPAFDGQYFIVPDLSGGTVRTAIAGILSRFRDDNGEYGISDEGWEALRQYFEHGHRGNQGDDFFAFLADGTTPLVTIWSGGIQEREEQFDVTLDFVIPEEVGVPFVVEQIGIVNGTENQSVAEEFVNWFGSAEVQGQWASEFSQLPANPNAMENAPQFLIDLHERLTPQDIDWNFVAENMDNWITKIELDIMP